jgi:hypothetical protein
LRAAQPASRIIDCGRALSQALSRFPHLQNFSQKRFGTRAALRGVANRPTKQKQALQVCANSFNDLTSYGKIQLACRIQIAATRELSNNLIPSDLFASRMGCAPTKLGLGSAIIGFL